MPADKLPEHLRKQAIDWLFLTTSETCSPADLRALQNWLSADRSHREAYALVQSQWQSLRQLQSHSFPAKTAALAHRSRSRHGSRWKFAAAAMVLLCAGVATFHSEGLLGYSSTYSTAKGEQRTVELADGSVLELNTESEVSVRLNRWRRQVNLIRGEAYFKVAHDAQRPFDVQIGPYHVRDIGTEFDVYQHDGSFQVAVQEGIVGVQAAESRELRAGQAIAVDADGQIQALGPREIASVTAWRSGQIRFHNHRLDEVLQEITRYHEARISIVDPDLAPLRVTGVFRTANLSDLLEAIASVLPVRVEYLSDRQILLHRKS